MRRLGTFAFFLLMIGAALPLAGCGKDDATGILIQIRIESDIDTETDVDGLQISAIGLSSGEMQSAWGWDDGDLRRSGTWALKPGSDDTETVMIRGDLTKDDADGHPVLVTTKRILATFKPGKVVKAELFFEKDCLGVICGDKAFDGDKPGTEACISGSGDSAVAAIACSNGDCRTNDDGEDPGCRDAEECKTDADCDDDNAETTDTCEDRICAHTGGGDVDASGEEDASSPEDAATQDAQASDGSM